MDQGAVARRFGVAHGAILQMRCFSSSQRRRNSSGGIPPQQSRRLAPDLQDRGEGVGAYGIDLLPEPPELADGAHAGGRGQVSVRRRPQGVDGLSDAAPRGGDEQQDQDGAGQEDPDEEARQVPGEKIPDDVVRGAERVVSPDGGRGKTRWNSPSTSFQKIAPPIAMRTANASTAGPWKRGLT